MTNEEYKVRIEPYSGGILSTGTFVDSKGNIYLCSIQDLIKGNDPKTYDKMREFAKSMIDTELVREGPFEIIVRNTE